MNIQRSLSALAPAGRFSKALGANLDFAKASMVERSPVLKAFSQARSAASDLTSVPIRLALCAALREAGAPADPAIAGMAAVRAEKLAKNPAAFLRIVGRLVTFSSFRFALRLALRAKHSRY